MDEPKFFRGLAKWRDPSENPATIRRLLECDDRLLGINQKRKEESLKDIIYEFLFIDEDTEYTEDEEKYRRWMMSQLFDNDKFSDSFTFTYPLVSHKTWYLEWQYRRYYRFNPKSSWREQIKFGEI